MRIIARKRLKDFWQRPGHEDAEVPLREWFTEVRKANWKSPNEGKKDFGSASIIANNRIVFNIKGNQYRLVTAVDYKRQIIYIRFIGTHRQYDGVNSEEI